MGGGGKEGRILYRRFCVCEPPVPFDTVHSLLPDIHRKLSDVHVCCLDTVFTDAMTLVLLILHCPPNAHDSIATQVRYARLLRPILPSRWICSGEGSSLSIYHHKQLSVLIKWRVCCELRVSSRSYTYF